MPKKRGKAPMVERSRLGSTDWTVLPITRQKDATSKEGLNRVRAKRFPHTGNELKGWIRAEEYGFPLNPAPETTESPFPDALRPCYHEFFPDQVEIREREGCQGTGRILRQPSVPDLVEAPEPLYDVERMLYSRPNPRVFTVDLLRAIGQGCLAASSTVHPVAHARSLK